MPFGLPDYHKDLKSLHIGCERPHAYFIPYGDEASAAAAQRDASPYFKSLCGQWDFKFFPSVTEAEDPREEATSYSDTMEVPSNWQYAIGKGYDVPQYTNSYYPYPLDPPHIPEKNPAALYRRFFTLDGKMTENKELLLNFEGVDSCFYLFINKKFAGYSQVSHMTSEFNITSLVNEGENEIALLVVKWCDGSYLEDQDMYRASGIFREVYLLARDKARIEDIFIKAEPSEDLGSASVSADISVTGALLLSYRLEDAEGNTLAEGEKALDKNETLKIAELASPKLWSDELPYLYTLYIRAGSEVMRFLVGVRRIEIRGNVVYINGKKVKVKGVNRHDSHAVLGHATPMEHIIRDIKLIKAYNCNMIRTSHYPNDPRFYELCDIYGLYVCDEADLECHGVDIYKDHVLLTDDPEWTHAYIDRAERMLERDKNHPSIIMWSVGNESGPGENHRLMREYFLSRDTSRIIHMEDESRRAAAVEDERKEGKFGDVEPSYYRSYLDIESRMYTRPDIIEPYYLKSKKNKLPFFLCEFCHAMGNGPGDIGEYTELIYKYDNFFGGCVWEYTDHSVATGERRHAEPDYVYGGDMGEYPNDGNFCVDGLVYPDRKPHTGFYEVKEAFRPMEIKFAEGKIKVKSRRHFKSLSDISLYYTVERNGKAVKTESLGALNILPGREKAFPVDVKPEGFTTLNVYAKYNTEYPYAKIGDDVCMSQFIISDIIPEKAKQPGATLTECGNYYSVKFGETTVKVGKYSGLIESICSNGKELICAPVTPEIWRAPADNDMWIRKTWEAERYHTAKCEHYSTAATEKDGKVEISARLAISAPSFSPILRLDVTYTFTKDGISVKTHGEKKKGLSELPRFGFRFTMPEGAENIRYFGYGPYESYSDKRLASRISLFSTTATENFEHYVRPQENSAHFGCKFADVSLTYGQGLYFSAESFSLSASHFTPEYLTKTRHDYELTPDRETTLFIDYKNAGMGSGSCGPVLKDEHAIREEIIDFEFNIKPCFVGNISPFGEYTK